MTVRRRKYTGKRTKSIRLRLGLSQKAFAAKLGVAQSTVGRWEIAQYSPSIHLEEQLDELAREAGYKVR